MARPKQLSTGPHEPIFGLETQPFAGQGVRQDQSLFVPQTQGRPYGTPGRVFQNILGVHEGFSTNF